MSKEVEKSNTLISTIVGGIIVGLVLLYFEYKTDFFTQRSDQMNTQSISTPSSVETLPYSLPSMLSGTPDVNYVISHEQIIGKYLYRIWSKPGDFSYYEGDNIGEFVTLSLLKAPEINIEEYWGYPVQINLLSGKDITGEGNPDLIVESYSGGAHCCTQFTVIDLGDSSISKHLETLPSNCPGEFKDLDFDGTYEFVTCDDIFAYSYCSFASSPFAWVVLKFVDGRGYLPATPNFRHEYGINTQIVADVARAQEGQNQNVEYWDQNENLLCPAIQVAIDYLYIGDAVKAEQEFRRLYNYSDVNEIWQNIYQTSSRSPLYTPYELQTSN